MIERSDLSILLSAAEVAAIADTALIEQEKAAVARAINTSANTGELRTRWVGELSDSIKTTLKDKGYKVSNDKDANSRDIPNVYIICCR